MKILNTTFEKFILGEHISFDKHKKYIEVLNRIIDKVNNDIKNKYNIELAPEDICHFQVMIPLNGIIYPMHISRIVYEVISCILYRKYNSYDKYNQIKKVAIYLTNRFTRTEKFNELLDAFDINLRVHVG